MFFFFLLNIFIIIVYEVLSLETSINDVLSISK